MNAMTNETTTTPPVVLTPTLRLDEDQTDAVRLCLDTTKRVVVINGSAGTGKTTIMRKVRADLTERGLSVVQCAPTGKAARRITEATGYLAVTIHKLLEFPMPGELDPRTGKPLVRSFPKRRSSNPLDFDVILVDEYAMVSSDLHRQLIDAMKAGAVLRAFGDINQLSPVEKFNKDERSPFARLINDFPVVTLTRIHRQGEGSGIIEAASRILRGIAPVNSNEFHLDFVADKQHAAVFNKLLDKYNFQGLDAQLIIPSKKGTIGVRHYNSVLQEHYQPHDAKYVSLSRHTWDQDYPCRVAVNDKVIWTKNDYNLNILNGEVGTVVEVVKEDRTIVIEFPDRQVIVPPLLEVPMPGKDEEPIIYNPQVQVDLAYALTTHKCQGSECSTIVYMLDNFHMKFLATRNNFYTAVTRASKECYVIATRGAFTKALLRAEV